ncbi:uncharacterized protein [Branchiostoma lanceolatum]|uniref:uncharacterized protein n=1 Tax=Branchiostoma lanceolatum TaxID=7740 RepID=UPI003454B1E9
MSRLSQLVVFLVLLVSTWAAPSSDSAEEISRLKSDIGTLKLTIEQMHGQMIKMQTEIKSFRSSFEGINALLSRMKSIPGQIAELESSQDECCSTVGALGDAVEELVNETAARQQEMAEAQAQYRLDLSVLKSGQGEIRESLETQSATVHRLDLRLVETSLTVDDLGDTVQELESSVNETAVWQHETDKTLVQQQENLSVLQVGQGEIRESSEALSASVQRLDLRLDESSLTMDDLVDTVEDLSSSFNETAVWQKEMEEIQTQQQQNFSVLMDGQGEIRVSLETLSDMVARQRNTEATLSQLQKEFRDFKESNAGQVVEAGTGGDSTVFPVATVSEPTGPPGEAGATVGEPTGPPGEAGATVGEPTGPPGEAGATVGEPTGPPGEAGATVGEPTVSPLEAGATVGEPTVSPLEAGATVGEPTGPPGEAGATVGEPTVSPGEAGATVGEPTGPQGETAGTGEETTGLFWEAVATGGEPTGPPEEVVATVGESTVLPEEAAGTVDDSAVEGSSGWPLNDNSWVVPEDWEEWLQPINECQVVHGASYRGAVSVTRTGRTCQRWDSQTPHAHVNTPHHYPSAGLVENYCRNPDGSTGVWCYTTDPGTRHEYCDIPVCDAELCQVAFEASYRGAVAVTETGKTCQRWDSQTPHDHSYTPDDYQSSGLEQNYCRNPDSDPSVWCYTTDPDTRWDFCDVPMCELCQEGDGATYRGTVYVTRTGKRCQRWDSQTPHEHDFTPGNNPWSGLEENYCRNPDGEPGVWCYTTDPSTRWERCDVPVCESCQVGYGTSYRGTASATVEGTTCQRWDSQTPHDHYYTPTEDPLAGLEQNYCRNPGGEPGVWCYTTDPSTRWDFCDVPICGAETNGCGGTLTAPPGGTVTSPNYPNDYDNNEFCEWTITVPEGRDVLVEFDSFSTEGSYDVLFINDGDRYSTTQMQRLTGELTFNRFTTTSNVMFLRFTSDGSMTYPGFQFSFRETSGCGGTLTAPPGGTVTSPNYPNAYGNSEDCEWTITVPEGRAVLVEFDSFSTEESYDVLIIFDGDRYSTTEMQRLTGELTFNRFTTTSNVMFLRFTSDGSVTASGFQFSFRVLE